jgi:phage terminase large subunit GpA-like protein
MKVITDRHTKTYHVDCTRCNSTLEITTDEVKVFRYRYAIKAHYICKAHENEIKKNQS